MTNDSPPCFSINKYFFVVLFQVLLFYPLDPQKAIVLE